MATSTQLEDVQPLQPQILTQNTSRSRHARTIRVAEANFSTNMAPFARRAESLQRYERVVSCLFFTPYYVGVFFWELGVAFVYRVLRALVNFEHRSQMPGDEDAEYQLEYVATYARHVRLRCLLFVGLVISLSLLYVVIDALYLHWHGLSVAVVAPTMSAATKSARDSLARSDLLALYANGNETEQSLPLATQFARNRRVEQQADCDWRTLVQSAEAYLQANRGVEHCCCAPMFGVDFNHLAFEMRQLSSNASMSIEKLVVVHFFNVVDRNRDAYDALEPSKIGNSSLGRLVVARVSQAHLFAWPPAESSILVLRQHTMSLHAQDWSGAPIDLNVSASQAYCAAECIDLFAGVSVYERARRQSAAGIKL